MFCVKCGTEIIEGAAYCSNCGLSIADYKNADGNTKKILLFKILSYLVLIILICFLMVLAGSRIYLWKFDLSGVRDFWNIYYFIYIPIAKYILVIVISVFIQNTILNYFSKKKKIHCLNCRNIILRKANYCDKCGGEINKENIDLINKKFFIRRVIIIVVFLIVLFCVLALKHYIEKNQYYRSEYSISSMFSNFVIEGTWQSIGEYGFGQAYPGAVVYFDGVNCNIVSPVDTYTLKKNGDSYTLYVTSFGSTESFAFDIEIDNDNHIYIVTGGYITELKRVN